MPFKAYPEDIANVIKTYVARVGGIEEKERKHVTCWYSRQKIYVQWLTKGYFVINCGMIPFDDEAELEEVTADEFWQLMKTVRKEWWSG
jgi:hypothetical protein